MLIIFDDVISSLKNSDSSLTDLFYNRRHLLEHGVISIILTSQKWTLVPHSIRSVLNMIIAYPLPKVQLDGVLK